MKKMIINSILVLLISLTIVYSIPCPSECICKPTDMNDVDFTRMSYLINCSNNFLNNDKLIYQADEWSINEDKIVNDNDDDSIKDYIISIDLSNSLSIKKFTSKTIQLTGFSFSIQSLLLTNQPKYFILQSNSFNSDLYQNLKILNLSSCCQQIPKECQQLFRPLNKLQILDLSGSDMYKTCLNTPGITQISFHGYIFRGVAEGTISSELTDLVLRNNVYDANTFSNTSHVFDGVGKIRGKLDLQNSRFQIDTQQEENCLFNLFQQIKILDLSSIKSESNSEILLKYLLKCQTQSDGIRQGEQLLNLYLRQLKLKHLPQWFTTDRFPLLRQIDLSNNHFYSIDINTFSNLRCISLAYNPIELDKIRWHNDTIYESINLRSTTRNRTFNLLNDLKKLFKLTTNIDYSENEGNVPLNIREISIGIDFPTNQFSLNISRTNLNSFQIDINDLRRLDISSNSLTELNLDEHVKLNYLDCSNQYLKKLILDEQLLELNEIKCSNNSLKIIENFSLLKNEQLKLIDLSNNLINSLENLFLNLNSRFLRTINLKSNLIQIIPSNIFHQKLISLYEINLSSNQIHTIKKQAFQAPNLQILDLTGNLLTNIEPKAILTASLRLFYIFNNTQQLTDRCQQSKSSDNLLSVYVNWFEQNGTLMKNDEIELDKCLNRYINQTKINWVIKKGKHLFGYYSLYITIGISLIGIFFGGMYFFRKNHLTLFARFQRYRQLDRNSLVENAAEMDQHEDDEIVMNLQESPFNKFTRVPTNV